MPQLTHERLVDLLAQCEAPLQFAYKCREENGMPVEAAQIYSLISRINEAICPPTEPKPQEGKPR